MTWNWTDTILEAMSQMVTRVIAFIPDFVGMLLLLGVGYLVAKLVQRIASVLLRRIGLDRALERAGVQTVLQRAQISGAPSEFVGRLVFWILMLTFLVSAAETLGLTVVSQTITGMVGYLPNVIGATVVTVVGLLVARLVRDVVRAGAAGLGVDHANVVSSLVHGLLIVIIASVAVTQLRIETQLLNAVLLVVLITVGAALAITVGLGTREVVHNLIAGIYARDLLEPGCQVTVEENSGMLAEVGAVTTTLRKGSGEQLHVPNAKLLQLVVTSSAKSGGDLG